MNLTPVLQNDFFKQGFLGYGEEGDILAFSFAHIVPLIIMVICILLIYFKRDNIRESKHENTYRVILGVICLLGELIYYWRLCYVGSGDISKPNMLSKFPLEVCDLSAILAAIMLLNKNKSCFQYCAHVCLTLGLLPLFSVDVISTCGPHYIRYYQYWFQHIGPVVGTFYMLFVHNFKIEKKGIIFTYIALFLLAAISIPANSLIKDAHFMYLQGDIFISKYLPDSQILRLLIVSVCALPLFFLVHYLVHKFNIKEEKRLKELSK